MRAVILALLLAIAGQAQGDPPAGYVLKCGGQWTASQNGKDRPLQSGTVVNPGEQLHSNPANALLTLVLYDGTYLRCPSSDKCKQPIQIPARAKAQGTISAFLDRLQNRRLPPVAFVTSRAAGAPPPPLELHEAVVATGGPRLDLSAVLSATPSTPLSLSVEPLDAPRECAATLIQVSAGERSVAGEEIPPRCNGLYQVTAGGEAMQAAYPATVLFVDASQKPEAERRLQEAVLATAQWQAAGEDEKRTFLRLSLGGIQRSLASPQ